MTTIPATLTTSLRNLIASGDFSGRVIEDASWLLEAEEIESMLYGHASYDYGVSYVHYEAFQAAEKLTLVDLDTWICTDTKVGFSILCLNGTPVALTWKSARKCDREFAFISEEAGDLLAAAWERHRPTEKPRRIIVDPATLDMPVAPVGAKPYSIETETSLPRLAMSDHGIALFLDAIAPFGGLDEITDRAMLSSLLQMAETSHSMAVKSCRNLASLAEGKVIIDADQYDAAYQDYARWADTVQREMIGPLMARLHDLGAEAAA